MPRISPGTLWRARNIHRAVAQLLLVCRDLHAAKNEFRWLREHANHVSKQLGRPGIDASLLARYVERRASGEPIQYILGSEYFGDLEIRCRPGVLIPRQETAASVIRLASLLKLDELDEQRKVEGLRLLDLCTGTGCIPLLFHHEFYAGYNHRQKLELIGVDVSPRALAVARENLIQQIADQAGGNEHIDHRKKSLQSIGFLQADVLKTHKAQASDEPPAVFEALQRLRGYGSPPSFDILISNPPYISPKAFYQTTARSVRKFEPRLALVPPEMTAAMDHEIGDNFYPKLLCVADQVCSKLLLFEVADMDQAQRVAGMILERGTWDGVEVWRDEPDKITALKEELQVNGTSVRIRGSGHGRSVFAYRNEASTWLKSDQCQN